MSLVISSVDEANQTSIAANQNLLGTTVTTRSKNDVIAISVVIVSVHLIIFLAGGRPLNIDGYWQIIRPGYMERNFWESILYFHGNPPMLSIIHFFLDQVSSGHKYVVFQFLLPACHVMCFLMFFKILEKNKIPHAALISTVFFLNPFMFLYFLYPFYSTFIFINTMILLYVLYLNRSVNFKLTFFACLLSFNATLRSSYHILIVWLLLLPFCIKAIKLGDKKYFLLSLIVTILPLSIYMKNFVLFDKFTTSTWMGMNMDLHIPRNSERKISRVDRFSSLDHFSDYIDRNNTLLKKYSNVSMLNDGSFNDIRYILISDLFFDEIKRTFTPINSLKVMVEGGTIFFDSPGQYPHLREMGVDHFHLDIFDLPNITLSGPKIFNIFVLGDTRCISLYLLVYPIVLCYLIRNIKTNGFALNYVLAYVLFFSCLYSLLDISEANRMRFEIEPMFLFLTVMAFSKFLMSKRRFNMR